MNFYFKKKLSIIYNFDLFGKEPELYYKGRVKKASWIGTFFTVLYFVLYIIIFLYKFIKMVKKEEVTFYETYAYSGDTPSINVTNENFYGGFALGQIPFIDETIYYPKVIYYKGIREKGEWKWIEQELEIEVCKLEYFDYRFRELFKDKPLNNLYCIKKINVTLDGYTYSEVFSYFYVTFFKCYNQTKDGIPCKNSTIIDKYLETTALQFYIQDIELTPQNYKSPIQISQKIITGPAFKHLYQKIYTYMQIVIIETDQDYIGLNSFSKKKTEKFLKYDESWIISAPNENMDYDFGYPLLEVNVQLSEKVLTQRRTFVKLIEIFGEIGGSMEFIFTIFNIFSSFLTDFLYKISLVNHLFIFNIDKKIIYIKDNNIIANNKMNNIKSEKNTSNMSKIENINQENLINSKIKTHNKKINSNKNETLLIGREIKIPNRNNKRAKTLNSYFSSSSRKYEICEEINKNAYKKEGISNNKTTNELECDLSKEKEIKNEQKEIIDKIKINKFYFIFCFICVRKRKNINNYLLTEAIKIILEKLDIMNIFKRMFKDEKILEKNKNYFLIEMTEECKQKINEYKYKKS